MFINNIDIRSFGAKVQNKTISHTPAIKSAKWLSSSSPLPLEEGEQRDLKPLKIKLLFEGKNREEVHENYSNFMSIANSCEIKFKDLPHTFRAFLESETPEESGIDEWLFVDLSFLSYEYGEEITDSFSNALSFSINNIGNLIAPANIEIIPLINMIDLTITGLDQDPIILKNLTSGKKIILDGFRELATEEGINKFDDVDLWDFPKLNVGLNTITVSNKNLEMRIVYKPMYV